MAELGQCVLRVGESVRLASGFWRSLYLIYGGMPNGETFSLAVRSAAVSSPRTITTCS